MYNGLNFTYLPEYRGKNNQETKISSQLYRRSQSGVHKSYQGIYIVNFDFRTIPRGMKN